MKADVPIKSYSGYLLSKEIPREGERYAELLLPGVLEAPEESILAGALLVGLHARSAKPAARCAGDVAGGSPAEIPHTALLDDLEASFRALAGAAEIKRPDAVENVWRGYWESLFKDVQTWGALTEGKVGIVGVAKTAMVDSLVAAKNVTLLSLGHESCKNHYAMEAERQRRVQTTEEQRREAVTVAREQVAAFGLETLTDPEGFLRFLEHDPVSAFEAVPAALAAFASAEAAQRVFLFAKLMGLAALAGALVRGEPKVCAAFNSPFPLRDESRCITPSDCSEFALQTSKSPKEDLSRFELSARLAVDLVARQRLRLARTRLVVVGGAPDVGKTTILREAFGFGHFAAGLSRTGQTDQITFALHPDGDENTRPVYAVDTPGYGDGEQIHRNDMMRLLMHAAKWIPGGVTVLWVVKAGRSVRQAADEVLKKLADQENMKLAVVVTHIDKFFEERYREIGPQWKDGILKGIGHKDPRWHEQRRTLMAELRAEVEAGVRSVIGAEHRAAQGCVYTCLGGWMTDDEEKDDEFAQPAPWPWARQEITDFFGVMGKQDLRTWVDQQIGL